MTETTATETVGTIADCGHEFCYKLRIDKGIRWCDMGHRLDVAFTSDGLSALMAAVSSAASESFRKGHTSTSISQWKLLLSLETAAKLTDDANSTRALIETLSS